MVIMCFSCKRVITLHANIRQPSSSYPQGSRDTRVASIRLLVMICIMSLHPAINYPMSVDDDDFLAQCPTE